MNLIGIDIDIKVIELFKFIKKQFPDFIKRRGTWIKRFFKKQPLKKYTEKKYLDILIDKYKDIKSICNKIENSEVIREGNTSNFITLMGHYFLSPLEFTDHMPFGDIKEILEKRNEESFDIEALLSLEENKKILLLGRAGSGKSTILNYFTYQYAKKKMGGKLIPLQITLKDWDHYSTKKGIKEFFVEKSEMNDFVSPFDHFERNLADGSYIFFVDDFNEVTNISRKNRLISEIGEFSRKYYKNKIIIASRVATANKKEFNDYGFKHIELTDFGFEQKVKFISKWLNYQNQEEIDILIGKIENNSRLKYLSTNPLMLSIIITVYEQNRKLKFRSLPWRRIDLYDKCANNLLRSTNDKCKTKTGEDISRCKHKLLEKIAFKFHFKKIAYFKENDLIDIINNHIAELNLNCKSNECLYDSLGRNGLIERIFSNRYQFSHLPFQEYFAAYYINQNREHLHQIVKDFGTENDGWWDEVVSLLLEMEPNV